MLGRPALHLSRNALESFDQEVVKIPSHAIDGQKAQVVDVEVAFRMGLPDGRRVDLIEPVDLADLRGDIVVQALERIVHIAVFMDLPVHFLEVLIDEIHLHLVGDLAQTRMLVPVYNVGLCRQPVGRTQQNLLDNVLDLLHPHDVVAVQLLRQVQGADRQPLGRLVIEFARSRPSLGNGVRNLVGVKFDQTAVSLPDFYVHMFPLRINSRTRNNQYVVVFKKDNTRS